MEKAEGVVEEEDGVVSGLRRDVGGHCERSSVEEVGCEVGDVCWDVARSSGDFVEE